MKKIAILVVTFIIVFSVAGCSGEPDINFAGVDKEMTANLIGFLESAALGGSGLYEISVDGDIGFGYVGDVQGTVSGAADDAELVSYSFLEGSLIEVGRAPVSDGKWGPVTVLYGPKVLVLIEGGQTAGYWLTPQVYAMAPFTAEPRFSDFVTMPRHSGLVALALVHSDKPQAAANLLAGLRTAHVENGGLPGRADVFGRPQVQGIDPAATAWAGYAAAVLARATNSNNLWEEARTYGLYLRDIEVPQGNEALLAGWLLFTELSDKYAEFGYLPDLWQPEVEAEYNPLVGTWILLSGEGDLEDYLNSSFEPESATQKWLHYNLLAALDLVPDELNLSDVKGITGGKAVFANDNASLEATSWMLLTLSGKFR